MVQVMCFYCWLPIIYTFYYRESLLPESFRKSARTTEKIYYSQRCWCVFFRLVHFFRLYRHCFFMQIIAFSICFVVFAPSSYSLYTRSWLPTSMKNLYWHHWWRSYDAFSTSLMKWESDKSWETYAWLTGKWLRPFFYFSVETNSGYPVKLWWIISNPAKSLLLVVLGLRWQHLEHFDLSSVTSSQIFMAVVVSSSFFWVWLHLGILFWDFPF